MIEIFKNKTHYDIVGKFKMTAILSTIAVIISVVLIVTKTNYGVDFSGGAEIQLKSKVVVTLDKLRSVMDQSGFKGVSVQTIGLPGDNEFLVKVQASASDLNKLTNDLQETIKKDFSAEGMEIRKVDIVGPKAGAQLRLSAIQAIFWAFISIMVYLGLRFDFRYAPGAVIALFHDTAIVWGIFAVMGWEFNLSIIAALLSIIGYSVNDTVVIYDRIREHENKYAGVDLKTHVNTAINETFSRTILTSTATMFVTVVMQFFGGDAIKDFFVAMSIGILVGTYSSIFIASPITLAIDNFMKKNKKNEPAPTPTVTTA